MTPQAQLQLLDELSLFAQTEQNKAQQYRTLAAETFKPYAPDARHYDALAEAHEEICQEIREIITSYQWGENQ